MERVESAREKYKFKVVEKKWKEKGGQAEND